MSSQKTLTALRLLSARHFEYIVVGMVAGVPHGAPVTTFDLDVVQRRTIEGVERLLAVLCELSAVYRGDPRNLTPHHSRPIGPGHHVLTTAWGTSIRWVRSLTKAYEGLLEESELVQLGASSSELVELGYLWMSGRARALQHQLWQATWLK